MNKNESGNSEFEERKQKKILHLIMIGILVVLFVNGFLFGSHILGNREEEIAGGEIRNESRANDANEEIDPTTNPTTPEEYLDSGETRIRLQFGGDVFLHQGPLDAARTGEDTYDFRPFFEHIAPFIDGDFVMANMESPVDAFGNNERVLGFPYFNAPFEILEALTGAGFNHLSSANNHAFDKGLDGIFNTVANFERAGITHTGLSRNAQEFNTPTIIDVNGIQIGVLAYTDVINHQGLALVPPGAPERDFAVRQFRSYTLDDLPRMADDIADLRVAGADLVVVSLHWGAEYADAPNDMQRRIAAELSDAGADVIMGHHSKTVQPIQWHYRADGSRALIMYSLGNFLADQTRLFPNATTAREVLDRSTNNGLNLEFAGRTQFGMLVSLEVTQDLDGNITLQDVNVLPTLCMRDFSGNTLGNINGVSVMPLVDGELPDFVTDEDLRYWGRTAYEHVVGIVGRNMVSYDLTNE